ncbi:MAG: TM1812 family CRISPR-associated protein [Lachnospiraceae bacterium]
MKKFITTAPRQWVMPRNPEEILLYDSDTPELKCDIRTPFPVVPMVNGYVTSGDTFQVIIITAHGEERGNCAEENFTIIKKEMERIAQQKGAVCNVVEVPIPLDESLDTHLETFGKLIENVEKEDTLYADITYGTKTLPLLEMMLLNYAYQCKVASVECVCYGEAVFERNTHAIIRKKIYNITSLFLMDQIVNTLAKVNNMDPLRAIKSVLEIRSSMDSPVDEWEE